MHERSRKLQQLSHLQLMYQLYVGLYFMCNGQKIDTETECKSTNKSNKHHITCKQATN